MRFYNVLPFYEIYGEDADWLTKAVEHESFRPFKTVRCHKFSGGWTVYVMLWKGGEDNEKHYVQKL